MPIWQRTILIYLSKEINQCARDTQTLPLNTAQGCNWSYNTPQFYLFKECVQCPLPTTLNQIMVMDKQGCNTWCGKDWSFAKFFLLSIAL